MPHPEEPVGKIDWSLTTWEGSRREQLRRWSELSLREILLAQEEMQELAEKLGPPGQSDRPRSTATRSRDSR